MLGEMARHVVVGTDLVVETAVDGDVLVAFLSGFENVSFTGCGVCGGSPSKVFTTLAKPERNQMKY